MDEMYQVEIGNHLSLEVVPNMDESEPPVIWIRDNVKCEKCHPSMFLDPSVIQPLLNELADVANALAKTDTNEFHQFKRRVTSSLEVEVITEKPPDRLGIEDEERPMIIVYSGGYGPEKRPSLITLHLSDIAPFRDALEEISTYSKTNDTVLLYNEGTHAMQRGNYKQAIACFREAILLDPQHNLAVFNLAMCYDLLGQLDDALLWYQRAMDLDPNDPDPVYNIAEIYFRRKNLPQAEKLCREALDLFQERFKTAQFMPFPPGRQDVSKEQFLADMAYKKAVAYCLMAHIKINEGKLQGALQSIQSAIEIHPYNAEWFLLMAQIHRSLGNRVEAQNALRRAGELDPNSQAKKSTISSHKQGNSSNNSALDEMTALYERNVHANPNDIGARAQLAAAYGWGGRVADAVREFNMCLRSAPYNGEVLMYYGLFLCSQGNLRKSIENLDKAARISSDPANQVMAIGSLGAIYHMAGNLSQAIGCWETILDPAFHPLVGSAVNLSLGIAYLQEGRVNDAWRKLEVAASMNEGEDEEGMVKRFPRWALNLGKTHLSSMPRNADMQEVLNLLVAMGWGIFGPVAHVEMQRRVVHLLISA